MKILRLVAVLAAALLLGGCGSSGPKSNGLAAKTASQIIAAATAAAVGSTSVHVYGSGTQGGTTLALDLYLVAGKGGRGHINVNGLSFDIVRVGSTAYFRGDARFWKRFGSSAVGALLKGRWLAESSTTGPLASFSSLTDIAKFFSSVLGAHGTLSKLATSTVNGHSVVALNDAKSGGVLYISATGEPYPLELAKTTGKSSSIKFEDWNTPVQLAAPANSIDISKLKTPTG